MDHPRPQSSSAGRWFIALVFIAAGWTSALAEPVPFAAVRVDHPPKLDGSLDDPLWGAATPLTEFRQVQPATGAAATERTEARAVYDSDRLYIGIRCDEPPTEILGNDLGRDSRNTSSSAPAQGSVFESDDYVALTLDTYGRRQEGYYFAVNPAGAWADGLVYNSETLDLNWDTVWFNRVHRDARGWSVVIVVPFKSIAFDAEHLDWRINIERMLRRKQEIVRWAAVNRQRQVYSLAELGRFGGLANVHQGLGIDFEPYALVRHVSPPPGGTSDLGLRSGADVVWKILPSLSATLTLNTDFAQTDVDQRQVNLTRFPLFYPEKRDFFLRDEPFFAFGGINSTTFLPYHSRSIGLENGTPVGIPVGAKFAGRAGPLTIGFLSAIVDRSTNVPRRDLTVGRLSYQVTDDSTAGLLFTNGDPRGPGRDTVAGVDYNLTNNTWVPGRTLLAHAWVIGTHSDRRGGDGEAASIELGYPNDPYSVDFLTRYVSPLFDPALGFVQQTGVWEHHLFFDRYWHPNGSLVRDVDFGSHSDVTFDLHGRDIAEDADIARLTLTNPSGDNLAIWITDYADRPPAPFTVAPGVAIPAGFYRWQQEKIQWVTSVSRPLGGVIYFRVGDYYRGTETEEKGTLVWRPNPHWALTGSYDLYQVKLPQGHFDARILSGGVTWHWTPYVFGSVLGQYDTQSRLLGMDYRLEWIVAPRRTLYLVIERGYLQRVDGTWQSQGGPDIAKIGWTWQF